MSDDQDHQFTADVLNASLILLSILVAVITFLAVEYKRHEGYEAVAEPIKKAVIGTAGASVFAGGISLAALIQLRSGCRYAAPLAWAFGILIAVITAGVVYITSALIA